ncbi:MAG TPA: hypothetical protein VEA59_04025 [Patescibacteria group bacterium]|nr:hypothetical protein [Patescibacteria group bacterium]
MGRWTFRALALRLGFVFLKIDKKRQTAEQFNPGFFKEPVLWDFEVMVVHKSRVGELQKWLKQTRWVK